jgi:hypothetical protein
MKQCILHLEHGHLHRFINLENQKTILIHDSLMLKDRTPHVAVPTGVGT